MNLIKYLIIILTILTNFSFSQVENVQIIHPVYKFLKHAEIRGLLPHFSSSSLPLQKSQIKDAISKINNQRDNLSSFEINSLEKFIIEFEVQKRDNSVLFFSPSDSSQILSEKILSNDEKYIYHYKHLNTTVNLSPLGDVEYLYSSKYSDKAILGNLGVRFYGTIDNCFGYFIQATNGSLLSGNRMIALEDSRLKQNIKFAILNSDFDFTESHISYRNNWFNASIGRENISIGSGINQTLFVSNLIPPMDAISLTARFEAFEYNFKHFSLINIPNNFQSGFNVVIDPKMMALHRFSIKPSWGEISFIETVTYSDRNFDLAYLNPLSFLKSLEHALRDRDNSMMGADLTLRLFDGIQIKGTFLLDDIIFSEIGRGFWSNKTAWNIGLQISLPLSSDVGIEYSRIEPYMFTHFNVKNSYTNDQILISGYLQPNSDEIALNYNLFWGNRYPLQVKVGLQRHGENILDSTGTIVIKNVGSNPLQVRRPQDSDRVKFLDGVRNDIFFIEINGGIELVRGFNLQLYYSFHKINNSGIENFFRIKFSFDDF